MMKTIMMVFVLLAFLVHCVHCSTEQVVLSEADAPTGLASEQLESIASGTKQEYKAEVKQLMHLIINSIYSNVEVFLRELVSNASDALDKIRILSLTDRAVLGDNNDLSIRIRVDVERQELHIIDSGVGMTASELQNNLGTIAKSGTKEFARAAAEGDAQSLIGQFGVGFYSAFLVADRVTVASKHNNESKQMVWQSDAAQNFVIAEDPRGNTLKRGTHITLHVKDSHLDLLAEEKIKELIGKYSEFIAFPIYLWTARNETEEVPLTAEELEAQAAEEAKKDDEEIKPEGEEDGEAGKAKEKKTTKSVTKVVHEWTLVNAKQPIWTRPSSDVTAEEYTDFYKHISKDWQEPVAHEHFKAEGDVNFKAIVYIPSKPQHDYWQGANENAGLKLYVKRVYITDNWKNILPKYLGFIRGVVDAEDVDLNVSREVLQQSKTLNVIKSKIVRKAIAMIQELSQNDTKWEPFWTNYHKVLKYGVLEDAQNKERLSKLLQFHSTNGNLTTFQAYVDRFQPNQTDIYYLAGESLDHVKASPLLEKIQAHGLEAMLLVDPIDEYVFTQLAKFDGKHKLTNVAREGLKLPGEKESKEGDESEKEDASNDEWAPLLEWLGGRLKSRARKVIVSKRLTKSPAALVAGSYGLTANMERIVKSQALGDSDPSLAYQPKPVLEINIEHPILKRLRDLSAANPEDPLAIDTADILFESSAVASGYQINDPVGFVQRMTRIVATSLNAGSASEPAAEKQEL